MDNITMEMQNKAWYKICKFRSQLDELMNLKTSTLVNMGYDSNKIDKMDIKIDKLMQLPMDNKKYNAIVKLTAGKINKDIRSDRFLQNQKALKGLK